MRFILTLLFSISLSVSSAQSDFDFEHIDTVENATADQLYIRAREWVATTFKDAKEVIQMDDKASGKIICKGLTLIPGPKNAFGSVGQDLIWFTATIDVRDGKARLRINNVHHEGGLYSNSTKGSSGGPLNNEKPAVGWMMMTKRRWETIQDDSWKNLKQIIRSFHNAMQSPSPDDF